jgi:hypothetical protein
MTTNDRTETITRHTILQLLSDEEIARVSDAETAKQLVVGDEYVNLEAPDLGIHKAFDGSTPPMGRVLPKKAVGGKTWRQIEALLGAHRIEGVLAPPIRAS